MIRKIFAVRHRLAGSPLATRMLIGGVWSVAGSIIASGITLIVMIVSARLLGKEMYGQFVAMQTTIGMVGVFAGVGVGVAATRFAAALRSADLERLGRILALAELALIVVGIFLTAALVIGGEWLASSVLGAPEMALSLPVAALALLPLALDGFQKSVLVGFEAMRPLAIGTVSGAIASFPIMLALISHGRLEGAAFALVVAAVIQFAISRVQMMRELKRLGCKPNVKGIWRERQILWRFALPALLVGALVTPSHWVVQAMLANTVNGYAELAVLGVAMQWFNLVMFVPGAAGRVVLPILTEHVVKNDRSKSRRILYYAIGANAVVAVPLSLVVCGLSPIIMGLYGESFEREYLPLILAVLTASLLAILSPIGALLNAMSRMWLGALMNVGWATVYVGLAFFLVPKGATGAMVALASAYLVHAIWTMWFAWSQEESVGAT